MYPAIGTHKHELDTPALCVDLRVLETNIAKMAVSAASVGVGLRPHSKTHKCPIIAHMQIAAGAHGVTCAKLGEAEVMAQAGIRDILIANQIITPHKINRLMGLAAYTDIMVAVDTAENVADLSAAAEAHGVTLRVLLEVDIGMARCGVMPGAAALALARRVVDSKGLRFEGIMGYEGHAVMISDYAERTRVTETSLELLTDTADLICGADIPVNIVSSGGTGTYMITGAWPGITELQVGSYATMDVQYREKVGLRDFDYALTLLTTVVGVRGAERAISDAGIKSVTNDFGLPELTDPAGWELIGLSEEHGWLTRKDGDALRPGDRVELVPSHGCTTINLHDYYHVIRDDRLVALWPIAARGKIR